MRILTKDQIIHLHAQLINISRLMSYYFFRLCAQYSLGLSKPKNMKEENIHGKKAVLLALAVFVLLLCMSCSAPAQSGDNTEVTPSVPRSALDILADIPGVLKAEQVRVTDYDDIDWSGFPEEVLESMHEMVDGIVDRTLSYSILYEVEGVRVQAFCSVPEDYLENPRPLILFLRGGNGDYGAINQGSTAAESYMSDCVVLSTQYRETYPGNGKDEFGGADLLDVLFWIERAKDLTFADTDRFYMIGESRGGMELCLALREVPEGTITAAASISGIYNLKQTYLEREDMRSMLSNRVGGTPETAPEAYESRSAVTFADRINTPLLLVHSTGDTRVSYSQAQIFSSVMKDAGKTCELWTREDDVHGITSPKELAAIVEWLENQ
ncbi:MAG: prolyl oligopeptidase family serine peptidase [Clostridia bacterium]|nr:prolyl oligopeptidase family serine peptidase [Clostridia bacterium]